MRATFPSDFTWGAATSAYQVEGAWDADDKGESIWDRFSHTPGSVRDGATGDVACDQYHRYPEDIQLLRHLGLGAYRFSLSWARLFPAAGGGVNRAGLDYYERLVDELLANGITPYPTLFHWDLPQWLQDRGGWTNRAIIESFSQYADAAVRALSDRVTTWTVFNEPQVFVVQGLETGEHAPGLREPETALRASHVVNLAHAAAIRTVRAVRPGLIVGSAFNIEPGEAATDDDRDAAAAERSDAGMTWWYVDPLLKGTYPAAYLDQAATLLAMDIRPGDLDTIAADLDFIGVNVYFRHLVAFDPADGHRGFRRFTGPGPRTSFDWEIWPESMHAAITRFSARYGAVPLYVTENGCASDTGPGPDGRVHDDERISYLRDHLGQLARARDEGCDVRGYFVWSLLDNFEWAAGFSQRFGIVWCDLDGDRRRIVKDSGYWLRDLIATGAIEYPPTAGAQARRHAPS